MTSALQDWVHNLSLMQQSVLITACRGPDTLHKNHVAKLILRWYRRCFLISAFDKKILNTPYDGGGGSFTGPSIEYNLNWEYNMNLIVLDYLQRTDEIPH